MRVGMAAALLVSLAFAGCFGGDSGETGSDDPDPGNGSGDNPCPGDASGSDESMGEPSDDSSENGTGNASMLHLRQAGNGTGNQTGNGTDDGAADDGDDGCPALENSIPKPIVGVDIKTAAAPVDVTYAYNASDADGDNLTWTLDVNGDGVMEAEGNQNNLPGTFTFTYDAAGEFTAMFVVSDGQDNATADVTVTIIEPIPEADPFLFEAYFQEPCPQCSQGANTGIGYRSGNQGIDHVWSEIPPEFAGTPYLAKTTGQIVGLSFRDACDGGGNVETPLSEAATLEGLVPEGAACVLMWEQGPVRGGKLSFVADGTKDDFPEDTLCYTDDFTFVGSFAAGGVYNTDGLWFYTEDNGVPGLQLNGNDSPGGIHRADCEGGDTVQV